ncbi:protein PAXX [Anableps anableps]
MERDDSCFSTVVDMKSEAKYVCYTRRKGGGLSIRVTDAAAVWSSDCSEDTLKQLGHRLALKSTEDHILKFRASCLSGDVSVVVQNTSADLRVGSGPAALNVTLTRMEAALATEELKELLFNMADRLAELGGGSPAVSPLKSLQRCSADFKPRQQQQQHGAWSGTVKRRLPGASLINPGTKKKMQATGVAFDDEDED